MDLELLLAHPDDGLPVLSEGLPRSALKVAPRLAARRRPEYLYHDSSDPSSLSAQGWGIVAPEGRVGDRLLEAIDSLSRARREDQGGAPGRIYRVPPALGGEDAERWISEVYWDDAVREENRPGYLLVLGDADLVSWELQQRLAEDLFVGRLAFGAEEGYEAYAAKVLRWERGAQASAARALFYATRDGTAATELGYRTLMAPTLALACERLAQGAFAAREIVEIADDVSAGAASFLEQTALRDPSALLSISHGLGAPRAGWRSVDEQRALQGAMSLGRGEHLAAEDVARRPFLPGGIWFFLAGFSAGVPSASAYERWLHLLQQAGSAPGPIASLESALPRAGDRPFVAALPQAALQNPDGPLAVVGQVDLAWIQDNQGLAPKGSDRPALFQRVFKALLNGARVGAAQRQISRFSTQARVELSMLADRDDRGVALGEDEAASASKAALWMLTQELSTYVLLGDPAVRLPLSPGG